MKRQLKTMLLSAAMAAVLAVSAGASDFDHCADKLKDLGLFQGTASGYELDRAPTRAEAATMLVRLLGAEDEAKQLTYTAPFTDLQGWEAPYVQYLYENGLTNGATATTFEPEGACSAQMYATFLLRALGYTDTDPSSNYAFSYAEAVTYARVVGLADYANLPQIVSQGQSPFLRDHVAALSYTALATPVADDLDVTLLDQLVTDGAVTGTAAQNQRAAFALYREYQKASASTAQETRLDMSVAADMKVSAGGLSVLTIDMPISMQMNMDTEDLDKSVMAMTTDATIRYNEAIVPAGQSATQKMSMKIHYTDGMYYLDSAGEKSRTPMSFAALQAQLGEMTQAKAEPISLVKQISKSGSIYSVDYQMGVLNDMMQQIVGAVPGQMDAVELGEVTSKVTFSNNKMTRMQMTMQMTMVVDGQKMDMVMTMDCRINKTGSGVTVTLPSDLSTYPAA